METLYEFRNRTSFIDNSLPLDEPLYINRNLSLKVNEDGSFKPFYGDTMVFLLNDEIKEKLSVYQNELYKYCGDIFADKLIKNTFHLTLHDLYNGPDNRSFNEHMKINMWKVKKIFEMLDKDDVIHLKSTKVFNMVNTSIVLGFEPVSEEDCFKLMMLYEIFQEVVCLNYPFTPHVTFAYYKPFETISIDILRNVIDQLNCLESFELSLSIKDLVYQTFTDMNHYSTQVGTCR